MRNIGAIHIGWTIAVAAVTGCSGVTDCREDAQACASMLNANGAACAEAFQLKHSETKRKNCENAIKRVGDQRTESAVPGLVAVLSAPHTNVPDDNHVQAAADALGDIGSKEAVDALISAIDLEAGTTSDPRDKMANRANEAIADALGAIGDDRAVGPLLEVVDKSPENFVVLKAVRALGQIGSSKAVEPIEKIALEHNNKFMRKNAVQALGQIGDPTAIDTLIKMMFIEYQGVSFYREASFALFEIGPASADLLLETMALKNQEVNAIFEATGGIKESAIRAKCGFVLADLRDPRAVEPLQVAFKEAVEKGDPVVLTFTAPPLGALEAKEAVPLLSKQMLTIDQSMRDPMMQSLVMIGDRAPVPEMIQAMTQEHFLKLCMDMGNSKEACLAEEDSMYGALETAADHASNLAGADDVARFQEAYDAATADRLKKYLEPRLARVKLTETCKGEASCWVKQLDSSDALVREKAAWELKYLEDPSSMDALAKALGDKDRKTRYAAIYAYWDFGDDRAIPRIKQILKDEEGSSDFVRVNEDLRRLLVHLERDKG
ncbi:MAG: HEAT repeat domain-containing protein [Myxococcales bacterium]|nr:HEAT repeat domain-containing protein [Myxococcales bacterium]